MYLKGRNHDDKPDTTEEKSERIGEVVENGAARLSLPEECLPRTANGTGDCCPSPRGAVAGDSDRGRDTSLLSSGLELPKLCGHGADENLVLHGCPGERVGRD